MNRRWIGAVARAVAVLGMGVLGPGMFGPAPASADDPPGQYKVDVDNQAGVNVEFCIKSDTSKTYPPGSDRACSGTLLARKTKTLYVDARPGDAIYLDFEVFGEHTHNDNNITNGHQCTATGSLLSVKVDCHLPTSPAEKFSEPPLSPFAIDVGNPNDPAMTLINLLAWCVTAAGVAGFIIVGMSMAIQLRRGDPGEMSEYWRSFVTVSLACLLGMAAGPIVQFLHIA